MPTPRPKLDHQPYRPSFRADVDILQDALESPSPLGDKLDEIHRSHSRSGDSDKYSLRRSQRNLSHDAATHKEFSIFGSIGGGGGSTIANSVVSTVVDGVHHTIAHWKVLLFGQFIAFCLALSGAASEELNATCDVSIPLTQTTAVGVVLTFLGAIRMKGWCAGCCLKARGGGNHSTSSTANDDDDTDERRRSRRKLWNMDSEDEDSLLTGEEKDAEDEDDHTQTSHCQAKDKKAMPSSHPRSFCCGLQTIHAPWWIYLFVGLVAVEARYLIFLAFRYTTFTFIYLVDALAIPSAMFFSKFLLGRSYQFTHLLGGFVCISGIVVSTVGDLKNHEIKNIGTREDIDSVEHLKGDFIAISGAILLGLDDVLSEIMIKEYGGVDELLFMKWFFGSGIAFIQLLLFERGSLMDVFDNQDMGSCSISTVSILFAGYVVLQSLEMAMELSFLKISEAALLNLSQLTSDLYATIFTIFTIGVFPSGSYLVALILIVVGIVLYEAGPSPIGHSTPSNIKIRMRNLDHELDSNVTDVAANVTDEGHFEMT